jgi:hypothetical protein
MTKLFKSSLMALALLAVAIPASSFSYTTPAMDSTGMVKAAPEYTATTTAPAAAMNWNEIYQKARDAWERAKGRVNEYVAPYATRENLERVREYLPEGTYESVSEYFPAQAPK